MLFASLFCKRFEQGEWRSVGKQAAERAVREPRFVLISFNVWFSQHRQLSRAEELLRVLRRENADVVCLQEATPRFLKTLLADEFVRAHYCVSTTPDRFADLNSDIGYDTFVLCKPWCAGELRRYRVTSRFARSVYINRTPAGFAVATIHLESGVESVRVRGVQMEQIYGLLEELQVADRTFFCGDLNHCVTLGENHLRPTTVDVWPLLRPNDAGWTENEQVNLMLASKPGKVGQSTERVFFPATRETPFLVCLIIPLTPLPAASAGALRPHRGDGRSRGLRAARDSAAGGRAGGRAVGPQGGRGPDPVGARLHQRPLWPRRLLCRQTRPTRVKRIHLFSFFLQLHSESRPS